MSHSRARLMIVAAALLWSTGGAAVKLSHLSALQIAGGRALFAGIVLWAVLPAARRGFKPAVLLAGAYHAANCVLFVFANQQTTAGNVIFIQNIAPVWVLLLTVVFGQERPRRSEIISVPISLVGVIILAFDDPSPGRLIGNLAALLASVLFALLILSYRRLTFDEGLAAVTAGNFMIAVGCLPFALHGPAPTAVDWGAILFLGVLQQATGHLLFISGMQGATALEGALIILLEPIMSPLWAFWLVDERPGPLFLAGATILIAAQVWRALVDPMGAAPYRARMRFVRAVLVLVILASVAGAGAYAFYLQAVNTPRQPAGAKTVPFPVPKGATLSSLGSKLEQAKLLNDATIWKIYLKLNPGVPSPKAGRHELSASMTIPELIEALAAKPISEDFPLTMVEGWRLRDADAALAEKGLIAPGAYIEAASDPTGYRIPFSAPSESLEGYLLPDTYMVRAGAFDPRKLVQRQLDEFHARFVKPHQAEIQRSGRSLSALVKMASLLEREEHDPKNRPKVAGVLYKRLDARTPLGVDATSRYTIENWNDRRAFLRKLRDRTDPYNTRTKIGLPPTPIGAPSLDALKAALRPKKSPYWYYLHDKQGRIHFAKTAKGHERNRKTYNVY